MTGPQIKKAVFFLYIHYPFSSINSLTLLLGIKEKLGQDVKGLGRNEAQNTVHRTVLSSSIAFFMPVSLKCTHCQKNTGAHSRVWGEYMGLNSKKYIYLLFYMPTYFIGVGSCHGNSYDPE